MKRRFQTAEGDFREDDLRQAARLVGQSMLDALPAPEECRHTFSPEFQARMAPLLARARRRERLAQGALVAALVLALAVVGKWAVHLWLSPSYAEVTEVLVIYPPQP